MNKNSKVMESLIIEKKKQSKEQGNTEEFDISKLYNYYKAYIIAKFKLEDLKLKEVKLDKNYFKIIFLGKLKTTDYDDVSRTLIKASSVKFDIKETDLKAYAIPEKDGLVTISIEYIKN
jgi:hypothetical protein